jgi:hypothetical protein
MPDGLRHVFAQDRVQRAVEIGADLRVLDAHHASVFGGLGRPRAGGRKEQPAACVDLSVDVDLGPELGRVAVATGLVHAGTPTHADAHGGTAGLSVGSRKGGWSQAQCSVGHVRAHEDQATGLAPRSQPCLFAMRRSLHCCKVSRMRHD